MQQFKVDDLLKLFTGLNRDYSKVVEYVLSCEYQTLQPDHQFPHVLFINYYKVQDLPYNYSPYIGLVFDEPYIKLDFKSGVLRKKTIPFSGMQFISYVELIKAEPRLLKPGLVLSVR